MRFAIARKVLAIAGAVAMLTMTIVGLNVTVAPSNTAQAASTNQVLKLHAGDAITDAPCNEATGVYDAEGLVKWTNVPVGVTGTIYIRTSNSSTFEGWTNFASFNDWTVLGTTSGSTGSMPYNYTLPGNTTSAPWYYIWIDWSDGYNQQRKFDDRAEGLTGNCTITKVTPAVLTPPLRTCTAEAVVDAVDTDKYSWLPSGPIDARVYTAVAKTGITLIGQTVFGPFDLSKITGQVCAVQPPDESRTTHSYTVGCDLILHQTDQTFTTHYSWSDADQKYVPDTEVADTPVVLTPRSVTLAELDTLGIAHPVCNTPCTQNCTPPQPKTGDDVPANWFQAQVNAAMPWLIGAGVVAVLVLVVVIMAAVRKFRRPRVTG